MDCYYLFVKTPTLEELVTYLEFVLIFSTNPETNFSYDDVVNNTRRFIIVVVVVDVGKTPSCSRNRDRRFAFKETSYSEEGTSLW